MGFAIKVLRDFIIFPIRATRPNKFIVLVFMIIFEGLELLEYDVVSLGFFLTTCRNEVLSYPKVKRVNNET
jgi:hypothetical protein